MSQGSAAPLGGALAAGAAAALASSVSIAIAAPSLTDPLPPALSFLVLAPFLAGVAAGGVFCLLGRLLRRSARRPSIAVPTAALVAALPWQAICLASTSRAVWMSVVGALLAIALGSLLVRLPRFSSLVALVLAALPVILVGAPDVALGADRVRPVLVLGIDAATWDQIDPMFEKGELPALRALVAEGASATLVSEEPTLSPRVWTVLATGVPPEQNGILAFQSNRSDLKAGRVWDAAAAAGAKVGLMRWLITWPPDPLPGFCIPGWLSPGLETLPPSAGFLKVMEKTAKGGGSLLSLKMVRAGLAGLAVSSATNAWKNIGAFAAIVFRGLDREDAYWRTKLVEARLSADLYLHLMARERAEFSALILYPVDSLGHDYWRYHEPEMFPGVTEQEVALRGEVVRDAYRECDRLLGEVLARFEPDEVTVMVISDHGMQASTKGADTGEGKKTARIHAGKLFESLALEEGSLDYSVAGKQLILSPGLPDPEGTDLLRRVHQVLREATVVESGESPFGLGPFDAEAQTVVVDYRPEVLADPAYRIRLGDQQVPVGEIFREEKRSGTHHERGILVMRGPGVRVDARLQDASIYDVTPTLLYAMGLPVPADLPGEALARAFTPEWVAAHPLETQPGGLPDPPEPLDLQGDEGARQEALQELGYVDE